MADFGDQQYLIKSVANENIVAQPVTQGKHLLLGVSVSPKQAQYVRVGPVPGR